MTLNNQLIKLEGSNDTGIHTDEAVVKYIVDLHNKDLVANES